MEVYVVCSNYDWAETRDQTGQPAYAGGMGRKGGGGGRKHTQRGRGKKGCTGTGIAEWVLVLLGKHVLPVFLCVSECINVLNDPPPLPPFCSHNAPTHMHPLSVTTWRCKVVWKACMCIISLHNRHIGYGRYLGLYLPCKHTCKKLGKLNFTHYKRTKYTIGRTLCSFLS